MKEKICGYYLDSEQEKIVLDNSKNILVVAGAGSGKTLTILGKINYLIKYKNIKPDEILCISFTRDASNSLKEKIKKEFNKDITVYTFHKLSIELLKKMNIKFEITDVDTLSNIIHKFIYIDVLENPKFMKIILNILEEKYKNKKKYITYIDNNKQKVNKLENLIETFIHLFKCNNHKLNDFNKFLKTSKKNLFYQKEKILLTIILNIYLEYQRYLNENNEIDFDDMITLATKNLNNNLKLNYKYIIIDEYQDTSYVRFLLIKKLLELTNANLLVVGDDFQSIYRFTGCDLSLFIDFTKYFKNSKIMKIQNTYRNSLELITVAGSFVMKNQKQIRKTLNSNKKLDYPIEIVYYKNIKEDFYKLVSLIYNKTKKNILVLGRNNYDINMVLNPKYFKYNNNSITCLKNYNIKINYLTVHKSKGLEEENVIMINLRNDILGFPCKIKNNQILRFVTNNKEKYLYSEERRLFYVGLTRTKNKVYLFTPLNKESIFVKELKKDYKKNIKINKIFLKWVV